jgi:hypothetical protein
MRVKLIDSPKAGKKFRAILVDLGKYVDFGGKGYSDFTIHKEPERMRFYVQRHGGFVTKKMLGLERPKEIINTLIQVKKSRKEYWSKKDIDTAGFWSRWLLWSYPSMSKARAFMKKEFGITFV